MQVSLRREEVSNCHRVYDNVENALNSHIGGVVERLVSSLFVGSRGDLLRVSANNKARVAKEWSSLNGAGSNEGGDENRGEHAGRGVRDVEEEEE